MSALGLVFASPWLLIALAALPLLWWLLRVTPPAPRQEVFPAVRLLLGLRATAETPARTPWWLLALRMLAAALVIVGLARPVLEAGSRLAGVGPVLLVVDDGWASASDWAARMASASTALDRAERAGRQAALLATAPNESGAAPTATPAMPVPELRTRLAALRPKPWPVDRAAAADALREFHGGGSVVHVADGLTDGAGWDAFAAAARTIGPVLQLRAEVPPAQLMLPPRPTADALVARLAQAPRPTPTDAVVLAQSGDGRTLARVTARIDAGAATGEAPINLPPELRNRLARLVLEGPASAGSVMLLDERSRRRPVGLVGGDATTADAPLTGGLFYLRRALEPYTEVRQGDVHALLSRDLSMLVLADHVVPDGEEHDAIAAWVRRGGLLVRFMGPQTAERPDSLLPVRLLPGDRQLGGAMSWSQPAGLAPFAGGSPFEGLDIPADVRVTRQVLAEPGAHLADETWARLADGTPLVTQVAVGSGRIVLFHITANADWSDLPLSGLFVDMLRRLVGLAVGVAAADDPNGPPLAPAEALDGFGQLGAPPSAATALLGGEASTAVASPRHPPGLYGPESGRRALNLANGMAARRPRLQSPARRPEPIGAVLPETALAPWLMAAALALLAFDLLLSLRLRGLLRRGVAGGAIAGALLVALAGLSAALAQPTPTNPALATRLAYVVTGDAQVDGISRSGLAGLSDYVNRRTAASLAEPAPVTPGDDDLEHLSAALLADRRRYRRPLGLSRSRIERLHGAWRHHPDRHAQRRQRRGFRRRFRRGAAATDARARDPAAGAADDGARAGPRVLSAAGFPGRYAGDTVWVQRDQDRTNDSVSPVIIGGHDWAAAWAVDAQGRNPYATIPGGARQRTLAYRFGVNLVMYALTGNYKGDQVHVPALLERLGQ